MALREQNKKGGREKPWTLDQLRAGFDDFYQKNNRYPTAHEVDAYPYLPSARSIERSFGGLIEVRKKLGIGSNLDFRTGTHSSQRAHTINERAHLMEKKAYEFLTKRFGKEFVHREYFFTDDHRTRADFFVYDTHKGFCVDVFYPSSRRNMLGCLNLKLGKYSSVYMREYPVIYVQMNEQISESEIEQTIASKTRKLPEGQYLMSWASFQKFCNLHKALQKLGSQTKTN